MRKINYLMSLLMLFMVSSIGAWAQGTWKAYSLGDVLSDIPEPGTPFALKGPGLHWQKTDAEVGTACPLTENFYNGTGNGAASLTNDCVFTLVAGEVRDNLPTYYLQRVSDGKYLSNDNVTQFVSDLTEAFHFWMGARTSSDENSKFYSMIGDAQMDGTPTGPLFVIRDAETENARYLSYWNSGGFGFMQYIDTNVGEAYSVNEITEGTGIIAQAMFEYPQVTLQGGTAPGDIPQDSVDAYNAAYLKIQDMMNGTPTADEAYAAVNEMIDAYNACSRSIVMPEAGKYYIIGGNKKETNATLYVNGNGWCWSAVDNSQTPTTDPKYIVKLEAGKEEGTFNVRNLATGKYLGPLANGPEGNIVAVTEDPTDYIIGNTLGTNYFYITVPGASNGVHAQLNFNHAVSWDYKADASQWRFYVPTQSVEELDGILASNINKTILEDVIDSATTAYINSRAYKPLDMPDGQDYGDHGYLKNDSSKILFSTIQPNDGKTTGALVDGIIDDGTNYVHSAWQAAYAPNHAHFFGVDLGEAINTPIVAKYSRRMGNNWKTNFLSYPTEFRVYATNDTTGYYKGDFSKWTEIGTASGSYVSEDTTTLAAIIDLGLAGGEKFRFVRFDVTATGNSKSINGYPFFYVSELGFYNAEYDAENSLASSMDPKVVEDLGKAIPAAKKVVASGTITDKDIADLRAAYHAFYAQYPDTAIATNALDEARDILKWAGDGSITGVGYAPKASIDKLQEVVDTEATKIVPLMKRDEIDAIKATVEDAVKAYRATVPQPEVGTIYYIINRGSSNGKGYAVVSTSNSEGSSLDINYLLEGDSTKVNPVAETDLRAMWRIEKMGNDSLAIRNLGTGLYMNSADGDAIISKTPRGVVFEPTRAGAFGIIIAPETDEPYLNNNANTATTYFMDNNSHFGFEPVDEVGGADQCTYIDAKPGYQIVCLPYGVSGFTGTGSIYTVAGVTNDNMLALNKVDEDAFLSAGTPFVLYFDSEEDGQADLGFNIDDLTTDPQTVNGVVGVFTTAKVGEGMGVLDGGENVVVSTAALTTIESNHGYIGKGLPTVEGGDVNLQIDGTITGIGNVVVAPAANGKAYDLQGRRVVKPTKGLYIINGKKVFVK